MPKWIDRGPYKDYVHEAEPEDKLLGYLDGTREGYVRSFTKRADGTWDLQDHASAELAVEYVETHAIAQS